MPPLVFTQLGEQLPVIWQVPAGHESADSPSPIAASHVRLQKFPPSNIGVTPDGTLLPIDAFGYVLTIGISIRTNRYPSGWQ